MSAESHEGNTRVPTDALDVAPPNTRHGLGGVMRSFVVEDRTNPNVVVEGRIDPEGKVHVDSNSLAPEKLTGVIEEIEKDVAQGFSGGRLRVPGLEWLEMFRP